MLRIWGARSLAPIYPDKTNLHDPTGEAWLTGPDSKIETGPFAGPINQAWQKMSPEWRGTDFASPPASPQFPLLVKFLFPADQLSIQVHPNDAYAAQNGNVARCLRRSGRHSLAWSGPQSRSRKVSVGYKNRRPRNFF